MLYKVSIIIPVWNAEPYLHRCLDSVCQQTLRDIEIICVDDASTDNSLTILKEYAAKDKRVRVVSNYINLGETTSRNMALRAAKGTYLGFVDSDDAVDFNFYEKLYTIAKATQADIIKGNCRIFDYKGKMNIQYINDKIYEDKMSFSWQFWTAIYNKNFIVNNNICFPVNLIFGGDIVFLNRAVLRSSKIETIDDTYYNYYRRKNSNSSKILSIAKIKSLMTAYEIILEEIKCAEHEQPCDIDYNTIFEKTIFRCISVLSRNVKAESRQIIADAVIRLYGKYRNCESINTKLSAEHPNWYKFLLSNDAVGLTNYLLKYNKFTKFVAADLRSRHSTKKYQ
jgi:glycosyltransferase involved in cell wall biosynthesis